MSTPVPVEMRTISHSNVLCTFNLGCVPAICPENLIWRSRLVGKSFVLYPWPHLKNDSHSGAPIFVCLKVLHGLCEVDPALDANIQKSFQIWYSNHVTYFVKHKIPYVFFFLPRFSFIDTGNSWNSRERSGAFLFHCTTSIRSRTFRYLFAILHVRWLPRIFVASLVTTRHLLDEIFHQRNYHLIDCWWQWNVNLCLFDNLILDFFNNNMTLETH